MILVLIFLSTNLFADKWDDFLKDSGFPKKVVDNGSLVTGKILDATVSYQIKNNDGDCESRSRIYCSWHRGRR